MSCFYLYQYQWAAVTQSDMDCMESIILHSTLFCDCTLHCCLCVIASPVEGFIKVARDRYDFSPEQSLGILYWFDYDVSKALNELAKYTPFEG